MNIIGTWKVAEVQDVLNKTWRTAGDIAADAAAPDYLKEGLAYRYSFTEDGQMRVLFPIPEGIPQEQIDAALASGELTLFDEKTMVLETKAWKEEDGKLLFNSGAKGEVLGETVNPWIELVPVGDLLEMTTYRLKKED